MKHRLTITFLSSIFIFVSLFVTQGVFYNINDNIKSLSIKFKNDNALFDVSKNAINDSLVIVKIDEQTINQLGFPMPRSDYIPVLKFLQKAKAGVIGFDIIFANRSNLPEADDAFAEAIKEAKNVVLGGARIPNKDSDIPAHEVIELPLEKFYKAIDNFGYYQPNIDRYTNRVVSFFPYQKLYDADGNYKVYPHFGVALLHSYYAQKGYFNSDDDFYYLKPNQKVPFSKSRKKDILINFLPKPKGVERLSHFTTYSFLDVYNGTVNPEAFKDKIVIIGATSKGIKDVFTTSNGLEYGVFVLGNIVNTLLNQSYLLYFPGHYEWILIFLLLLLSFYSNLSRSGYTLILSNITISVLFLLLVPMLILFRSSYLLSHLFELFLALIFSLALGNTIKYLLENNDKIKLSRALSEYVSKAIAEEIVTSSGNINLNGEKKHLAIFFSDIEGFTTISEKFSPEELVAFLREYLSEMSNIIMDNKGFINKYEGDAIMGLWGAFGKIENKSFLLCKTALEQQKKLKELNTDWMERGFPEVKVRIGLHIGDAIVGNIGAEGRKMEYTALGDNINLDSRLEGINKYYGTYICVSDILYQKEKENFVFRYLDEIRVKGKDNSLKIYELIGYKGDISEEKLNTIDEFEKAVSYYCDKDFAKAKEIFLKLEKMGDAPSSTYIERCSIFLRNGIKDEWDHIWSYTTK